MCSLHTQLLQIWVVIFLPSKLDFLWFHIKAVGNWTRELREHFQRHADTEKHGEMEAGSPTSPFPSNTGGDHLQMQPIVPTLRHIPNLNVRVLLDGPYGASTTALFDTEHAVLIGAGIGVTPFASVLGSVLAQFRRLPDLHCPNCDHSLSKALHAKPGMQINNRRLKLRKLDFIWVSREQENIQWFIDLLEGWEQQQQSLPSNALFMDCQLYITSLPDVRKNQSDSKKSLGMLFFTLILR